MSYLVFVRHGESTYNAKGVWTGWLDPPLSKKGFEEARQAGQLLRDIKFDIAYTSDLLRAQQTLDEIKKILGIEIPTIISPEIKERHYGDYTDKNKWEVEKELGEVEFKKLRRSFDYPVPNGESLKDVYNRTVPYFTREILPKLKEGKNVLIVAHGNSLRALTKYIENISDEDIADLEIPTGQVIVYKMDPEGKVISKEIRGAE
ncbi:MAG: 2,3-diphosphoglycerate-dependent phosphoglycerate mutase [Patescibacteria group bacterium]|mgnify:CR=1 FL=1